MTTALQKHSQHHQFTPAFELMSTYKWQFAPRFRRNAFGWKSDTPIQRIKEALAEIKAAARKEPVLAAAGAVLFLEKPAPAIEGVDSPSGAIGTAVNRAIETLVTISADARATYNGFALIATVIPSLSRTKVEKKVPQNQRNLRSSVLDVLPSSRMMECSRQRQSMRTPHPLTVQWGRPTASARNYAGQRFRTR